MILATMAVVCFSQNNVFVGSSGVVIGTYNSTTDVITADNNAINGYLQQKVTDGTVTSSRVEKEGGYAYLVYTVRYTNSTGESVNKTVGETLRVVVPGSNFTNTDCEEHTCDGGCPGGHWPWDVCTSCKFLKENGRITGCECDNILGGCCSHSVRTVPCASK